MLKQAERAQELECNCNAHGLSSSPGCQGPTLCVNLPVYRHVSPSCIDRRIIKVSGTIQSRSGRGGPRELPHVPHGAPLPQWSLLVLNHPGLSVYRNSSSMNEAFKPPRGAAARQSAPEVAQGASFPRDAPPLQVPPNRPANYMAPQNKPVQLETCHWKNQV